MEAEIVLFPLRLLWRVEETESFLRSILGLVTPMRAPTCLSGRRWACRELA
jgi:hypothetical protein